MKKSLKKGVFILLAVAGFFCVMTVYSQSPPSMPGDHGQSGGAGAPIDGGIGILLALGAAYGGRKAYKAWKNRET